MWQGARRKEGKEKVEIMYEKRRRIKKERKNMCKRDRNKERMEEEDEKGGTEIKNAVAGLECGRGQEERYE